MYEEVEHEEEVGGGLRGLWGRWKGHFAGHAEDEDVYEEQVAAQATRPSNFATSTVATGEREGERTVRRDTFRVATGRETQITVTPVATFADVQKTADRLKGGEAQIINLEKTAPDVAERLIDFLNGVTYALDGYVERIAEGAYLFTPAHIRINPVAAEPAATTRPAAYERV